MGTNSITIFREAGQDICAFYRQLDSYPSCHGRQLAEMCASRKMVNGISGDRLSVANGLGCLAALIIGNVKRENAGVIYMVPVSDEASDEHNLIYEVAHSGPTVNNGRDPVIITCKSYTLRGYTELFSGTAEEFLVWLNKEAQK